MGAFSWYPYPQVWVRVHVGMGMGGPKFTHGLPVTNPTRYQESFGDGERVQKYRLEQVKIGDGLAHFIIHQMVVCSIFSANTQKLLLPLTQGNPNVSDRGEGTGDETEECGWEEEEEKLRWEEQGRLEEQQGVQEEF